MRAKKLTILTFCTPSNHSGPWSPLREFLSYPCEALKVFDLGTEDIKES